MDNQAPQQCVIPLHKPSQKELVFFFVSGILVSFSFAYFYESLVPAEVSAALYIVVLGPFIEELAKVFPVFYRHGETERSLVMLGLLIGLGFGIAEFAEYVFLQGVPPLARIPSIVFHASSATITAYGIAKKNPIPYYLMATLLHVANNFFALTGDILGLFGYILVFVIAYLLAWRYYNRASPEKMVV